jgi:AraC-like DNA-binding protein
VRTTIDVASVTASAATHSHANASPAGRYRRESTLAIGEIAYLLGYSEPAAFHRAFKRWYATTPEHFRAS